MLSSSLLRSTFSSSALVGRPRCVVAVSSRAWSTTSSPASSSSSSSSSLSSKPSPSPPPTSTGVVMVYGGAGALGREMIDVFRAKDWTTICVDYVSNPRSHFNLELTGKQTSWNHNTLSILQQLTTLANNSRHNASTFVNAVVVTAGGWQGGRATDDTIFNVSDEMWDANVLSALAASFLSGRLLSPHGLIVFTGSTVVHNAATTGTGTPSMLGYGLAKHGIHFLTKSLANDARLTRQEWEQEEKTGLKEGTVVAAIAPTTIDTPANRTAMPTADFSQWTPTTIFANTVLGWSSALALKRGKTVPQNVPMTTPTNGAIYQFTTANGNTIITTS